LGNLSKNDLQKYSNEWEDSEEWFWRKRRETEKGKEYTSDKGQEDFFVWYWQIENLQEKAYKDYKEIDISLKEYFKSNNDIVSELENIDKYFNALKTLIEKHIKNDKINEVLNSIETGEINFTWFRNSDLNIVLPLIAYVKKFKNLAKYYEFVRRIRKNYFNRKRERDNFVDWRYIIKIINLSDTEEDVLKYKTEDDNAKIEKIKNVELKEWYNEDEQKKDVWKKDNKEEVEKWENDPDLMGDLTPLWNAGSKKEITFDNMKGIWENFILLYNCYEKEKSKDTPEYRVLSNYVRLYRLLLEENRIGHIFRRQGMKGAWFSSRVVDKNNANIYFKYLSLKDFTSLFNKDEKDILDEIKKGIKRLLPKEKIILSDNNFSVESHLKAWLLIKVLYAEKENVLLSFDDNNENNVNNVIASYEKCDDNKLNPGCPFSLGSSCIILVLISPRISLLFILKREVNFFDFK
jgi:hypothetical protein